MYAVEHYIRNLSGDMGHSQVDINSNAEHSRRMDESREWILGEMELPHNRRCRWQALHNSSTAEHRFSLSQLQRYVFDHIDDSLR